MRFYVMRLCLFFKFIGNETKIYVVCNPSVGEYDDDENDDDVKMALRLRTKHKIEYSIKPHRRSSGASVKIDYKTFFYDY